MKNNTMLKRKETKIIVKEFFNPNGKTLDELLIDAILREAKTASSVSERENITSEQTFATQSKYTTNINTPACSS